MQRYAVNSVFGPTIQGEGGMTGTVCHFVRFSGCNMWDGRPETKADSRCPFCDTDFLDRTMMTAAEIVLRLERLGRVEWVTCSGGEPALQLDQPLVDAIRDAGYLVAIETNGTRPLRAEVDHVTMSPKLPPEETLLTECDSLKVLWPHYDKRITPDAFDYVQAQTKWLQPVETGDPTQDAIHIAGAVEQVYRLPHWRLSIQIHKLVGVE